MGCACEAVHGFPCQFPDETEFHAFDGQQWCLFHLPLKDAKGNKSPKDGWKVGEPDWQRFRNVVFERLRNPSDENPDPFFRHQVSDLRAVVFPHSFDFSPRKDTTLYPDFTGATFGIGARFAGATFGDLAGFDGTTFGDRAGFSGATFGFRAGFSGATFGDRARFDSTTFGDLAGFDGTTFGDYARFAGATFGFRAGFSGATFGDRARFDSTTFEDRARFSRATFGDIAWFMGATFGDEAGFSRATFGHRARFADATFRGGAHFADAVFIGSAFFQASAKAPENRRFSYVGFNGAEFRGSCSFENREFSTTASFANATFHDVAGFHGCKFHQGISFFGTKFLATRGADDEKTEELERAYRTLKLAMENLRARNEEARFFALEMECHRQRGDVPRFERVAAMMYKFVSNYGQSIARPLSLLGFLLAYGFAYFYHLAQGNGYHTPAPVLRFVVEQVALPFSIWSSRYQPDPWMLPYLTEAPILLRGPAALMTLTAFALIAVFLLALRRRFKMD